MNHVTLPEDTAKRIFDRLTSLGATEPQEVADISGLAVAISNAKPLPKKPGPKPTPPDSEMHEWAKCTLPRHEVGDVLELHGRVVEVVSAEDNKHGGQTLKYQEIDASATNPLKDLEDDVFDCMVSESKQKAKDDQLQCFAPIETVDREEAEKRFPPKGVKQ